MVGTSISAPSVARAVSAAAVSSRRLIGVAAFRTRRCVSLRRLLGVEHVASARAVTGELVARARVERGFEVVAGLLARLVRAQVELAALDRQRPQRDHVVILVAARRTDRGGSRRRELATV